MKYTWYLSIKHKIETSHINELRNLSFQPTSPNHTCSEKGEHGGGGGGGGLPKIHSGTPNISGSLRGVLEAPHTYSQRVYSDRTRQRQNDGVKHNAQGLEHMLYSQSEHSGLPRRIKKIIQ